MENLCDIIKCKIEEEYESVAKFSRTVDIPYSTLNSIIKNEIDSSRFSTVMYICRILEIDIFENKNLKFSDFDLEFISKLLALDGHGIELITAIIEKEYERIINF